MSRSNSDSPIQLQSTSSLCSAIVTAFNEQSINQRFIVAIVGAPGSGKSTLMEELLTRLKSKVGESSVIGIPMDGFHLDNQQLDLDGTRAVKGAPHTFDAGGLLSLLERIHNGESPVYAPEFDRASDLARAGAIQVNDSHQIVLVEGNYLLIKQPQWQSLKDYFALSISLDVSIDVLQKRLVKRWLDNGFNDTEAHEKANGNDIPNAHTVLSQSSTANIVFRQE